MKIPPRLATVLGLLGLLFGISGCAVVPPVPEGPGFSGYARWLAGANEATCTQALANARQSWQETGDARALARLGLIHGQWGHPGYAPADAAAELDQALAQDTDWPAYDRAFLQWRRAQLEHANLSNGERGALAAENARLLDQLKEAQGKLHAITEIERELGVEQ